MVIEDLRLGTVSDTWIAHIKVHGNASSQRLEKSQGCSAVECAEFGHKLNDRLGGIMLVMVIIMGVVDIEVASECCLFFGVTPRCRAVPQYADRAHVVQLFEYNYHVFFF